MPMGGNAAIRIGTGLASLGLNAIGNILGMQKVGEAMDLPIGSAKTPDWAKTPESRYDAANPDTSQWWNPFSWGAKPRDYGQLSDEEKSSYESDYAKALAEHPGYQEGTPYSASAYLDAVQNAQPGQTVDLSQDQINSLIKEMRTGGGAEASATMKAADILKYQNALRNYKADRIKTQTELERRFGGIDQSINNAAQDTIKETKAGGDTARKAADEMTTNAAARMDEGMQLSNKYLTQMESFKTSALEIFNKGNLSAMDETVGGMTKNFNTELNTWANEQIRKGIPAEQVALQSRSMRQDMVRSTAQTVGKLAQDRLSKELDIRKDYDAVLGQLQQSTQALYGTLAGQSGWADQRRGELYASINAVETSAISTAMGLRADQLFRSGLARTQGWKDLADEIDTVGNIQAYWGDWSNDVWNAYIGESEMDFNRKLAEAGVITQGFTSMGNAVQSGMQTAFPESWVYEQPKPSFWESAGPSLMTAGIGGAATLGTGAMISSAMSGPLLGAGGSVAGGALPSGFRGV